MKIDVAFIKSFLASFIDGLTLFQSIPLFSGNIFKKVSIIFEAM